MNYYIATVKVLIEQDNGKIKKVTEKHLVYDSSITAVEATVTNEFEDSVYEWELVSVVETKITKVHNVPTN